MYQLHEPSDYFDALMDSDEEDSDMEINFDVPGESTYDDCHDIVSVDPIDDPAMNDTVDFEDFMNEIDMFELESESETLELSDSSENEMDMETQSTPVVISRIEDMVLLFLKQLASPGSRISEEGSSEHSDAGTTEVLSRADYKIEIPLIDRRKTDLDGIPSTKILRYPKKSKVGSLRPFAQLFRVLDLAHEATLSGVPATKRDIYYKDVPLFKTQKVVDTLVDDIAATFELERSDLNIRSSSKGVLCGSGLTISLLSGETIVCNDTEGTLIPAGEDIECFSVDENVAWVLIVEKEAVFQTLCRLQITKLGSMPGPGIIITGKGYPDVATRHIVKSLADALPKSVPIMALVDGDPYGLDILFVYKYGSRGMRHEDGKLATRRIKWLGIWASELEGLGIDRVNLLPINKHDEKKAVSMLRRQDIPLPARWKKEMQYMLHNRRKAEIEILSSNQEATACGTKHRLNDQIGLQLPLIAELQEGIVLTSNAAEAAPTALSRFLDTPSESSCAPHALLVRYLIAKITDFVVSASHGRSSTSQA